MTNHVIRAIAQAAETAARNVFAEFSLDQEGMRLSAEAVGEFRAAAVKATQQATRKTLIRLLSFLQTVKETYYLLPQETKVVPARTEPLDLRFLFQNNLPGLRVHTSFLERIGHLGKGAVQSTSEHSYVVSRLKSDIDDRRLWRGLPRDRVSLVEDVAYMLKTHCQEVENGFFVKEDTPIGTGTIFLFESENGEVAVGEITWFGDSWSLTAHAFHANRWYMWGWQVLCPGKQFVLNS